MKSYIAIKEQINFDIECRQQSAAVIGDYCSRDCRIGVFFFRRICIEIPAAMKKRA